jgi:uncharacterized membrane protein YbhN (UPF0104 family)
MASGLKARLFTFLKVALAVGLLALVMWRVDWGVFFDTIAGADPVWVGAMVMVDVGDRFFMSAKWRYLLRHMGVRVRLLSALVHNLRGGLMERVVQWSVGGDIARTAGLSHETGQTEPVVMSVIIEKVVGLSALGTLAAGSFYLLNLEHGIVPWYWALPACIVGAGGLFVLPFVMMRERVATLITRLSRAIPSETMQDWFSQLPDLRRHWRVPTRPLLVFYGLTAVEQLVSTVNLLLLGTAFGLGVTVVEAISVMPIATFFSRLPITTQALGVREGLYVLMLGFIGVGAAEAFALALTVRVSHTVVFGVGTLVTVPLQRTQDVEASPKPEPSAAEVQSRR